MPEFRARLWLANQMSHRALAPVCETGLVRRQCYVWRSLNSQGFSQSELWRVQRPLFQALTQQ